MRITNQYSTRKTIETFATVRAQLDAAFERVTTGKRFSAASEDPAGALAVMQNNVQTRALAQYTRNIESASARVSLEDGALDALTSVLTRAKELAMAAASDTGTPETRKASAAEANQLLAQAVQIAGTKHEREFLFGGDRSTTSPYSIDTSGAVFTFAVAVPAPAGVRAVDIAPGQRITANHDGIEVFGDATTGPLAALQGLAAALSTGDRAQVAAALPSIDAAIENTQVLVAETGARGNQLASAKTRHTALAQELAAQTSDVLDIDIETAMTELVGRQTAFQAAMAATSRVSTLSLTDYLR